MEEANDQVPKNDKLKWYIVVPVILAIVFAALVFYFDSKKSQTENNRSPNVVPVSDYKPRPISPVENPRRNEELHTGISCAGPGHLEYETLKKPNAVWEIKKTGEKTTISLGKYRIYAPEDLIFDIPKFWLIFFSEKLGREEDWIYGLEASYVSGMRLIVNDFTQEIKLGGEEYMFIELDYPLGDLYPYDKSAILEYEFLIDLKCKNIKNGECLDNNGEVLNYLNGEEIISQLRIFAIGCQDFNSGELGKDIEVSVGLKY